jgi:hypothetical protein
VGVKIPVEFTLVPGYIHSENGKYGGTQKKAPRSTPNEFMLELVANCIFKHESINESVHS